MKQVKAKPLNAHAFAPFGQVVEVPHGAQGLPVNQGRGVRHSDIAQIEKRLPAGLGIEARLQTSVYRLKANELPFSVALLERHRATSQLFVPMDAQGYLVVVAPSNAEGYPDVAKLVAFTAKGSEGICYKPSVWHAPLVALGGEGVFLMQMWETGRSVDVEEVALEAAVLVVAAN
jgi:ureidoglycolate lyase